MERDVDCWLTVMDGVLVHEDKAIPGAAELIEQWRAQDKRSLVLSNNSIYTLRDRARAYVVGKPNPMMSRSAMNKLDAYSERTGMIGDRVDTDVVAGIEAGLHTVLVLSGIATRDDLQWFPFRPREILDAIADLLDRRDDPN